MKNPLILIVEDDGLIALSLMQLLQKSGFDVPDPVVSGEEAIDYVRTSLPDLVLMDIRLAGKIDGIEASRQIRKHSCIPIIFLTACYEMNLLARAEEVSPSDFIVKPFIEKDLLSAITKALDQ